MFMKICRENETRITVTRLRQYRGISCNYVGFMLLSLDHACPHLLASEGTRANFFLGSQPSPLSPSLGPSSLIH